jgi:putative transposase
MMVRCKGAHLVKDMILTGVRWSLAYSLRDRQGEALLEERRVSVDHATINRWVLNYRPQLEEVFHRRKRLVWISWHRDETSLRVKGP